MKTLQQWISENEFVLLGDDVAFLEPVMNDEGYEAECSDADWSLFIGDGFTVQNTTQGTSVLTNSSEFSVRSWPTHVEVRESNDGISAELLFDAVANALDAGCEKVVLVTE